MSKPIPEREARLRNLIEWLRNRDWAPAGADVCADDIEALLEVAARDDVAKLLAAARLSYSYVLNSDPGMAEAIGKVITECHMRYHAAIAEHEADAGPAIDPDLVAITSAYRALTIGGWRVDRVSLYDEEGVEGWRWTAPDGEEYTEIGDWNEPPHIPDILIQKEVTK